MIDTVMHRLEDPGTARDAAALARLRDRLTERAQQEDLLDVGYRVVDSPVGPLLLAATPQGLVRVAFESEGHDLALGSLAARVGPRVLRAPRLLDGAAHELEDYFAGRRTGFDLPVDLRLAHGFRHDVLEHLRTIRFGHTESYGQVAAATGHPRAVRAVGTACATNPLPIVVPCHRVVRRDGSLGGYLGGLDAKRYLLDLEAAA